MWSWSFPAGVVQSMPSPKLTNAIPSALELFDQRHRMAEVLSESVQPPADDDIDALPLGVANQASNAAVPRNRRGYGGPAL